MCIVLLKCPRMKVVISMSRGLCACSSTHWACFVSLCKFQNVCVFVCVCVSLSLVKAGFSAPEWMLFFSLLPMNFIPVIYQHQMTEQTELTTTKKNNTEQSGKLRLISTVYCVSGLSD